MCTDRPKITGSAPKDASATSVAAGLAKSLVGNVLATYRLLTNTILNQSGRATVGRVHSFTFTVLRVYHRKAVHAGSVFGANYAKPHLTPTVHRTPGPLNAISQGLTRATELTTVAGPGRITAQRCMGGATTFLELSRQCNISTAFPTSMPPAIVAASEVCWLSQQVAPHNFHYVARYLADWRDTLVEQVSEQGPPEVMRTQSDTIC